MKIQQIRNAMVRIHYAGKTFLTDPWLAPRGSMGTFRDYPMFSCRPEQLDLPMPLCDLPMPVGCIPTRVGNTVRHSLRTADLSVHPHACGEYLTRRGISGTKDGSSPRVWGILARPSCGNLPARFIPTRVGNTLPSLSSRA